MKRIFAFIGVVILVMLYITTLVCAIINSPVSVGLFKASVAMTILIPVLVFGYRLIYRVLKDYLPSSERNEEDTPDENASKKNE